MNTTLALTIIGIVQILVGIIFNLIPKEVNKKINPDIPAEAEDIAATFRVIIGGISIAMGVIALSCREIPTAQAMVLLNGMGIAFIIIAIGIISVKPRGFDKQIAFPPVILFSILTVIAFHTVNYNSKAGENQLVILSHIKSDKNDKFDKILFDEVMVAAAEYQDDDPNKQKLNDKAMRSFEILKPASMNQDSTWTYIFIADPYVEGALYNIMPSLKQKYGEEGAEEVFGRWSECFTDDGQDAYFTKRAEM
jgi:hypothetical protein